jgi:dihydrolipoamide dehydrogenase
LTDPNAPAATLRIPDLGEAHGVSVIEVLVKPGDRVDVDTPLVTLESDKATMDVPATAAGTVASVLVKVGDKVDSGTPVVTLSGSEATPDIDDTASRTAVRAVEPYGGEPYLDTVPIAPMQAPASPGATAPVAAAQPAPAVPHGHDFDLVVLGAGPGGYAAAFRAADLGLSVALVERSPTLGGDRVARLHQHLDDGDVGEVADVRYLDFDCAHQCLANDPVRTPRCYSTARRRSPSSVAR